MSIPRSEYPRPQFVRDAWVNLNGEWDFEIDYAKSGEEKKFFERDSLNQKITVPFCPESELSGIGNKDFMPCVWYRRNFDIPKQYKDKDVILHFGAVEMVLQLLVGSLITVIDHISLQVDQCDAQVLQCVVTDILFSRFFDGGITVQPFVQAAVIVLELRVE